MNQEINLTQAMGSHATMIWVLHGTKANPQIGELENFEGRLLGGHPWTAFTIKNDPGIHQIFIPAPVFVLLTAVAGASRDNPLDLTYENKQCLQDLYAETLKAQSLTVSEDSVPSP